MDKVETIIVGTTVFGIALLFVIYSTYYILDTIVVMIRKFKMNMRRKKIAKRLNRIRKIRMEEGLRVQQKVKHKQVIL
jgi:hypothetical protein